ncbi:MAG: TIGR00730 family Rossman fold protein [Pseudomonadota bacterium]
MAGRSRRLKSVCVYCGSSPAAGPGLIATASGLGAILACEGVRLVYGGGGLGLMGACARAARGAGGEVLGVMPRFLIADEQPPPAAHTVIVETMHERKARMFAEADAFAVLPGAIGTLEEAVELLSWRRLGLHAKPIAFFNPDGFWDPLFALFQRFTDQALMPPEFADCWRAVDDIADLLPTLRAAPFAA